MSEVTLYDSRGYPLDDPNGERNEKVRNMSRYGVVFTISYTQPYELATYFRAYESASGRMEQYYATYTTSGNRALLREFRDAVIDAAENDHGLEIERSESGENILSNLNVSDPERIGTRQQRSRAQELLAGGERLQFGVGSYGEAFMLINDIADARAGMECAVTEGESTHAGPMSTYDLIVEKGPYRGLESLGQTEALMNPDPPDGADEDGVVGLARDVGLSAGLAVSLLLVYLVVGLLLFSVFGMFALPGTQVIPQSHGVTIDTTDDRRTVVVSGETPAQELTLQYVNETNNSNKVASHEFNISDSRNVSYTNDSIPANASHAQVRYRSYLGIITWTVAPENGSIPVNSTAGDATESAEPTETSTATATGSNITDGNTTDGNITDGNATDGNVTDGNATDGNTTDGNTTDGNITDGNATDPNTSDGNTTDMDGHTHDERVAVTRSPPRFDPRRPSVGAYGH
jgi:hypothetical protein